MCKVVLYIQQTVKSAKNVRGKHTRNGPRKLNVLRMYYIERTRLPERNAVRILHIVSIISLHYTHNQKKCRRSGKKWKVAFLFEKSHVTLTWGCRKAWANHFACLCSTSLTFLVFSKKLTHFTLWGLLGPQGDRWPCQ